MLFSFFSCAVQAVEDNSIEKEIFDLTNIERQRHGLKALKPEKGLDELARYHSGNMLKYKFFEHRDVFGDEVSDRAKKRYSDLLYSSIGENLAHTTGLDSHLVASNIVDGWMNSPGHRENILTEAFTHLGVGVVIEGKDVYATQNFATPLVLSKEKHPLEWNTDTPLEITYTLMADFPRVELKAVLEYPDSKARFDLSETHYTLGYEPLSIEWLSFDAFKLRLTFRQGPGLYQICFGRGESYYSEGYKIRIK
ncbi:MAG: CAP domain-containing protein [Candidatus Cloacimonetes bacterium]|nr:CAP domain-containing protein [Candidatus Cloacimonadota bacterium]